MRSLAIPTVAVLEILGGIAGLGAVCAPQRPGLHILFGIPAFFVFSGSIGAGILLWRGSRIGYLASLALQWFQIFVFSIHTVSFAFFSCLLLGIAVDASLILHIEFMVGSSLAVRYSANGVPFMIGINIIAVLAFWALVAHEPKSRNDQVAWGAA